MKTKIQLLVVAVVVGVMASTAWAADINGKWKGSIDFMGQAAEVGFTFKANGSELTGTHTGPQGNTYPISEGKIEGDKITFVVNVTGQMAVKISYEGKIVGEEVKLTYKMDMGGMGGPPGGGAGAPPGGGPPGGGMGGPRELTLTKVK